VGDTVGVSVGDSVGELVGATVGDSVGESVGELVGESVGEVVGAFVGSNVGCSVGDKVGDSVGSGISRRKANITSSSSSSFEFFKSAAYDDKSCMISFRALWTSSSDGAGILSKVTLTCITMRLPGIFSFLRPRKNCRSSIGVSAAPLAISNSIRSLMESSLIPRRRLSYTSRS
jgi:hypothetical protein